MIISLVATASLIKSIQDTTALFRASSVLTDSLSFNKAETKRKKNSGVEFRRGEKEEERGGEEVMYERLRGEG